MKHLRRWTCIVVNFILVAFLLTGALFDSTAWAHAQLVRGEPKPGSTVEAAPNVVRAWFQEELASKGSSLAVWDARSRQVDNGKGGLELNDMDRKSLAATLKPIGPGTYAVKWTAVSADDGNVAKGSFRFTVAASTGAGTGPQGTAPPPVVASLAPLKIITPSNGGTISSPVSIGFETTADLPKLTMSKESMAMKMPHLHVDLDKRVSMPTMNQIVRLGAYRYRYHLGNVAAGPHTVRLYWAEAQTHKPIGPVQTITVTVK